MTVDSRGGKLAVRVCWGPRAETASALAQRWAATNDSLRRLDPPLSGWSAADEDGTSMPLAPEHLAPAIVAGAADRPDLGFSFGTVNDNEDDPLFFHASAGLAAPIAGLYNVAQVEGSLAALGDVEAVLAAMVAVWQPDYGQLSAQPWLHAQRPAFRQPWAGAVTYLSAARSRFVPDDLSVLSRRTPDGGLLLSVMRPDGTLPGVPEVAALGERLHESGAFAPIPTDRAHWSP